ncbi:MAG: hypothetical protein DRJ38_05325 [Thermoprotei archaeon]|nr:MAG: hypothetical protein DRJ38_05325 [Thermoprotei archaeon]
MTSRVKFGFKKTPDGYFLVIIPVDVFNALREQKSYLFEKTIAEYVGAEVFVKTRSRRLALEIARKAALLISNKNS